MNRQDAQELLPWFVAGTLSEEETRAVQAFIDSGEIKTEELKEVEMFAETVSEQSSAEPAYNPAILQKAMSQLDDIPQQAPEEPVIVGEAKPAQGIATRLRQFFQWDQTPGFAKLAMAAQFAAVLALAVFIVAPLGDANDELVPGGYETVAGSTSAAALTVAFAANASESDVRTLLLDMQLRIVDGPNSLGMYSLAIPQDGSKTEITERLNASELTTFVQPVAQ